jgi:hypothetical protein
LGIAHRALFSSAHIAEDRGATRRWLVADRNRLTAQRHGRFDPSPAAMVEFQERLPSRDAVAWFGARDNADTMVD